MLNILISFAQFERENMIERVKDKIGQTKRLGKWCGGHPPLGYDLPPSGRRLEVNREEAEQVRLLYATYLECRSLSDLTNIAKQRGWQAKSWTTKQGKVIQPKSMSRSSLAKILANVTYIGQVAYQGNIYPGEHEAIIDHATWQRVQAVLAEQRAHGGMRRRTKHFPLLKGRLRCGSCGSAMTYTYTRRGPKVYGYYACTSAKVNGAESCPMPNVPAGALDQLVIDEIAAVCRSSELSGRVLRELQVDHRVVMADAEKSHQAAQQAVRDAGKRAARPTAGPAEAQSLHQAEGALLEAELTFENLQLSDPARGDAGQLLRSFEPVWAALSASERQQLLGHLISHITLDGESGSVALTFQTEGIAELARLSNEPAA